MLNIHDKYFQNFLQHTDEKTLMLQEMEFFLKKQSLEGTKMLDVGCRVGSIWPAMTKYFSSIKAIDSIDWSLASEGFSNRAKDSNVDFECIDFLDFETHEKYDFIVMAYVLSGFGYKNMVKIFDKIKQVSQAGTTIIIVDPYANDHYKNTFKINKNQNDWFKYLFSVGQTIREKSYRSHVRGKDSLELYKALQFFLQSVTPEVPDYKTIRPMLESEDFKTETGYALPITNMFVTVKM